MVSYSKNYQGWQVIAIASNEYTLSTFYSLIFFYFDYKIRLLLS